MKIERGALKIFWGALIIFWGALIFTFSIWDPFLAKSPLITAQNPKFSRAFGAGGANFFLGGGYIFWGAVIVYDFGPSEILGGAS